MNFGMFPRSGHKDEKGSTRRHGRGTRVHRTIHILAWVESKSCQTQPNAPSARHHGVLARSSARNSVRCVCLWVRSAACELVGSGQQRRQGAWKLEGICDRRIRTRDGPENATSHPQLWHRPTSQDRRWPCRDTGRWDGGDQGQRRRSPCPCPGPEGWVASGDADADGDLTVGRGEGSRRGGVIVDRPGDGCASGFGLWTKRFQPDPNETLPNCRASD